MNYYEILGVPETATDKEIKKSYKQLVKKFHPDIFDGDKEIANKKIKEFNEAYEVLSNPASRKKYDETLQSSHFEDIKNDLQNHVNSPIYETPKENISRNFENIYQNYNRRYTTNYYGVSRNDLKKEQINKYNSSNTEIPSKHKVLIIIALLFLLIALLLISLLSLLKDLINKQSTFSPANDSSTQYEIEDFPYVTLGMDFYDIRDMIGVPDYVVTRNNGSYAYWGKSYIVFDNKDRVIDWKNNGDYFYTDTVTGKELRVLQELYNSILEQNSDFDEF